MARKSISQFKVNKIKKMLLEGKTSLEVASALGVSAATVNKYRANFKKQGLSFPNNRGRKPSKNITETKVKTEIPNGIRNSSFTYVIDGTNVSFNTRPKTILISKTRMLVEF